MIFFFRNNFITKINNYLIPPVDIIYFGGLINKNKLFIDSWGKCDNIMGMYAYMVNKQIIPNIIQKIETFHSYCDVILKNNFQENSVLLNDIIYTNLDDTNTSQKTKKIDDMIDKQLNQII